MGWRVGIITYKRGHRVNQGPGNENSRSVSSYVFTEMHTMEILPLNHLTAKSHGHSLIKHGTLPNQRVQAPSSGHKVGDNPTFLPTFILSVLLAPPSGRKKKLREPRGRCFGVLALWGSWKQRVRGSDAWDPSYVPTFCDTPARGP